VAHLARAGTRFSERLGSQFAASIAYFSLIALVPLLMLCFSALGLALTVFYRDALAQVTTWITSTLKDQSVIGGDQIVADVTGALNSWTVIGPVGLVTALWLGSVWMGHLKRALRVQLRPELGVPERRLPLPLDVLANLGMLAVTLVGVLVTFAAAPMTLTVGSDFLTTIGLPGAGWRWLARVASIVVSVVVGTGLFWVLFVMCAVDPFPPHAVVAGSVIGSVGLAVLQLATTYLIGVFGSNLSAAIFGPVFVLAIFLNLFARLMLMVAAWVGTWEAPPPTVGEGRPPYARVLRRPAR